MPHTILLVDDEYGSVEMLAVLLGLEGYGIVTASDGEEALSRLREQRVDLVITDFWMPKLNGLQLVERMRAEEAWRSTPVLLMTAAYDPDSLRNPTVADVLTKPLKFEVLLAAIRRVLEPGVSGS